ncbi:MAG: hypothetical protein KatS3mg083_129 [Candidatus Dojkabacteria bacterium]|nr:MAG: hypothetical protein KatS3mg083_129 [Candidatus Dojkabacteria bacterium]
MDKGSALYKLLSDVLETKPTKLGEDPYYEEGLRDLQLLNQLSRLSDTPSLKTYDELSRALANRDAIARGREAYEGEGMFDSEFSKGIKDGISDVSRSGKPRARVSSWDQFSQGFSDFYQAALLLGGELFGDDRKKKLEEWYDEIYKDKKKQLGNEKLARQAAWSEFFLSYGGLLSTEKKDGGISEYDYFMKRALSDKVNPDNIIVPGDDLLYTGGSMAGVISLLTAVFLGARGLSMLGGVLPVGATTGLLGRFAAPVGRLLSKKVSLPLLGRLGFKSTLGEVGLGGILGGAVGTVQRYQFTPDDDYRIVKALGDVLGGAFVAPYNPSLSLTRNLLADALSNAIGSTTGDAMAMVLGDPKVTSEQLLTQFVSGGLIGPPLGVATSMLHSTILGGRKGFKSDPYVKGISQAIRKLRGAKAPSRDVLESVRSRLGSHAPQEEQQAMLEGVEQQEQLRQQETEEVVEGASVTTEKPSEEAEKVVEQEAKTAQVPLEEDLDSTYRELEKEYPLETKARNIVRKIYSKEDKEDVVYFRGNSLKNIADRVYIDVRKKMLKKNATASEDDIQNAANEEFKNTILDQLSKVIDISALDEIVKDDKKIVALLSLMERRGYDIIPRIGRRYKASTILGKENTDIISDWKELSNQESAGNVIWRPIKEIYYGVFGDIIGDNFDRKLLKSIADEYNVDFDEKADNLNSLMLKLGAEPKVRLSYLGYIVSKLYDLQYKEKLETVFNDMLKIYEKKSANIESYDKELENTILQYSNTAREYLSSVNKTQYDLLIRNAKQVLDKHTAQLSAKLLQPIARGRSALERDMVGMIWLNTGERMDNPVNILMARINHDAALSTLQKAFTKDHAVATKKLNELVKLLIDEDPLGVFRSINRDSEIENAYKIVLNEALDAYVSGIRNIWNNREFISLRSKLFAAEDNDEFIRKIVRGINESIVKGDGFASIEELIQKNIRKSIVSAIKNKKLEDKELNLLKRFNDDVLSKYGLNFEDLGSELSAMREEAKEVPESIEEFYSNVERRTNVIGKMFSDILEQVEPERKKDVVDIMNTVMGIEETDFRSGEQAKIMSNNLAESFFGFKKEAGRLKYKQPDGYISYKEYLDTVPEELRGQLKPLEKMVAIRDLLGRVLNIIDETFKNNVWKRKIIDRIFTNERGGFGVAALFDNIADSMGLSRPRDIKAISYFVDNIVNASDIEADDILKATISMINKVASDFDIEDISSISRKQFDSNKDEMIIQLNRLFGEYLGVEPIDVGRVTENKEILTKIVYETDKKNIENEIVEGLIGDLRGINNAAEDVNTKFYQKIHNVLKNQTYLQDIFNDILSFGKRLLQLEGDDIYSIIPDLLRLQQALESNPLMPRNVEKAANLMQQHLAPMIYELQKIMKISIGDIYDDPTRVYDTLLESVAKLIGEPVEYNKTQLMNPKLGSINDIISYINQSSKIIKEAIQKAEEAAEAKKGGAKKAEGGEEVVVYSIEEYEKALAEGKVPILSFEPKAKPEEGAKLEVEKPAEARAKEEEPVAGEKVAEPKSVKDEIEELKTEAEESIERFEQHERELEELTPEQREGLEEIIQSDMLEESEIILKAMNVEVNEDVGDKIIDTLPDVPKAKEDLMEVDISEEDAGNILMSAIESPESFQDSVEKLKENIDEKLENGEKPKPPSGNIGGNTLAVSIAMLPLFTLEDDRDYFGIKGADIKRLTLAGIGIYAFKSFKYPGKYLVLRRAWRKPYLFDMAFEKFIMNSPESFNLFVDNITGKIYKQKLHTLFKEEFNIEIDLNDLAEIANVPYNRGQIMISGDDIEGIAYKFGTAFINSLQKFAEKYSIKYGVSTQAINKLSDRIGINSHRTLYELAEAFLGARHEIMWSYHLLSVYWDSLLRTSKFTKYLKLFARYRDKYVFEGGNLYLQLGNEFNIVKDNIIRLYNIFYRDLVKELFPDVDVSRILFFDWTRPAVYMETQSRFTKSIEYLFRQMELESIQKSGMKKFLVNDFKRVMHITKYDDIDNILHDFMHILQYDTRIHGGQLYERLSEFIINSERVINFISNNSSNIQKSLNIRWKINRLVDKVVEGAYKITEGRSRLLGTEFDDAAKYESYLKYNIERLLSAFDTDGSIDINSLESFDFHNWDNILQEMKKKIDILEIMKTVGVPEAKKYRRQYDVLKGLYVLARRAKELEKYILDYHNGAKVDSILNNLWYQVGRYEKLYTSDVDDVLRFYLSENKHIVDKALKNFENILIGENNIDIDEVINYRTRLYDYIAGFKETFMDINEGNIDAVRLLIEKMRDEVYNAMSERAEALKYLIIDFDNSVREYYRKGYYKDVSPFLVSKPFDNLFRANVLLAGFLFIEDDEEYFGINGASLKKMLLAGMGMHYIKGRLAIINAWRKPFIHKIQMRKVVGEGKFMDSIANHTYWSAISSAVRMVLREALGKEVTERAINELNLQNMVRTPIESLRNDNWVDMIKEINYQIGSVFTKLVKDSNKLAEVLDVSKDEAIALRKKLEAYIKNEKIGSDTNILGIRTGAILMGSKYETLWSYRLMSHYLNTLIRSTDIIELAQKAAATKNITEREKLTAEVTERHKEIVKALGDYFIVRLQLELGRKFSGPEIARLGSIYAYIDKAMKKNTKAKNILDIYTKKLEEVDEVIEEKETGIELKAVSPTDKRFSFFRYLDIDNILTEAIKSFASSEGKLVDFILDNRALMNYMKSYYDNYRVRNQDKWFINDLWDMIESKNKFRGTLESTKETQMKERDVLRRQYEKELKPDMLYFEGDLRAVRDNMERVRKMMEEEEDPTKKGELARNLKYLQTEEKRLLLLDKIQRIKQKLNAMSSDWERFNERMHKYRDKPESVILLQDPFISKIVENYFKPRGIDISTMVDKDKPESLWSNLQKRLEDNYPSTIRELYDIIAKEYQRSRDIIKSSLEAMEDEYIKISDSINRREYEALPENMKRKGLYLLDNGMYFDSILFLNNLKRDDAINKTNNYSKLLTKFDEKSNTYPELEPGDIILAGSTGKEKTYDGENLQAGRSYVVLAQSKDGLVLYDYVAAKELYFPNSVKADIINLTKVADQHIEFAALYDSIADSYRNAALLRTGNLNYGGKLKKIIGESRDNEVRVRKAVMDIGAAQIVLIPDNIKINPKELAKKLQKQFGEKINEGFVAVLEEGDGRKLSELISEMSNLSKDIETKRKKIFDLIRISEEYKYDVERMGLINNQINSTAIQLNEAMVKLRKVWGELESFLGEEKSRIFVATEAGEVYPAMQLHLRNLFTNANELVVRDNINNRIISIQITDNKVVVNTRVEKIELPSAVDDYWRYEGGKVKLVPSEKDVDNALNMMKGEVSANDVVEYIKGSKRDISRSIVSGILKMMDIVSLYARSRKSAGYRVSMQRRRDKKVVESELLDDAQLTTRTSLKTLISNFINNASIVGKLLTGEIDWKGDVFKQLKNILQASGKKVSGNYITLPEFTKHYDGYQVSHVLPGGRQADMVAIRSDVLAQLIESGADNFSYARGLKGDIVSEIGFTEGYGGYVVFHVNNVKKKKVGGIAGRPYDLYTYTLDVVPLSRRGLSKQRDFYLEGRIVLLVENVDGIEHIVDIKSLRNMPSITVGEEVIMREMKVNYDDNALLFGSTSLALGNNPEIKLALMAINNDSALDVVLNDLVRGIKVSSRSDLNVDIAKLSLNNPSELFMAMMANIDFRKDGMPANEFTEKIIERLRSKYREYYDASSNILTLPIMGGIGRIEIDLVNKEISTRWGGLVEVVHAMQELMDVDSREFLENYISTFNTIESFLGAHHAYSKFLSEAAIDNLVKKLRVIISSDKLSVGQKAERLINSMWRELMRVYARMTMEREFGYGGGRLTEHEMVLEELRRRYTIEAFDMYYDRFVRTVGMIDNPSTFVKEVEKLLNMLDNMSGATYSDKFMQTSLYGIYNTILSNVRNVQSPEIPMYRFTTVTSSPDEVIEGEENVVGMLLGEERAFMDREEVDNYLEKVIEGIQSRERAAAFLDSIIETKKVPGLVEYFDNVALNLFGKKVAELDVGERDSFASIMYKSLEGAISKKTGKFSISKFHVNLVRGFREAGLGDYSRLAAAIQSMKRERKLALSEMLYSAVVDFGNVLQRDSFDRLVQFTMDSVAGYIKDKPPVELALVVRRYLLYKLTGYPTENIRKKIFDVIVEGVNVKDAIEKFTNNLIRKGLGIEGVIDSIEKSYSDWISETARSGDVLLEEYFDAESISRGLELIVAYIKRLRDLKVEEYPKDIAEIYNNIKDMAEAYGLYSSTERHRNLLYKVAGMVEVLVEYVRNRSDAMPLLYNALYDHIYTTVRALRTNDIRAIADAGARIDDILYLRKSGLKGAIEGIPSIIYNAQLVKADIASKLENYLGEYNVRTIDEMASLVEGVYEAYSSGGVEAVEGRYRKLLNNIEEINTLVERYKAIDREEKRIISMRRRKDIIAEIELYDKYAKEIGQVLSKLELEKIVETKAQRVLDEELNNILFFDDEVVSRDGADIPVSLKGENFYRYTIEGDAEEGTAGVRISQNDLAIFLESVRKRGEGVSLVRLIRDSLLELHGEKMITPYDTNRQILKKLIVYYKNKYGSMGDYIMRVTGSGKQLNSFAIGMVMLGLSDYIGDDDEEGVSKAGLGSLGGVLGVIGSYLIYRGMKNGIKHFRVYRYWKNNKLPVHNIGAVAYNDAGTLFGFVNNAARYWRQRKLLVDSYNILPTRSEISLNSARLMARQDLMMNNTEYQEYSKEYLELQEKLEKADKSAIGDIQRLLDRKNEVLGKMETMISKRSAEILEELKNIDKEANNGLTHATSRQFAGLQVARVNKYVRKFLDAISKGEAEMRLRTDRIKASIEEFKKANDLDDELLERFNVMLTLQDVEITDIRTELEKRNLTDIDKQIKYIQDNYIPENHRRTFDSLFADIKDVAERDRLYKLFEEYNALVDQARVAMVDAMFAQRIGAMPEEFPKLREHLTNYSVGLLAMVKQHRSNLAGLVKRKNILLEALKDPKSQLLTVGQRKAALNTIESEIEAEKAALQKLRGELVLLNRRLKALEDYNIVLKITKEFRYMPRYFSLQDERLYFVRIKFSDDDPGFRIPFTSLEEAEEYAAKFPISAIIEKGGSLETQREQTKRVRRAVDMMQVQDALERLASILSVKPDEGD